MEPLDLSIRPPRSPRAKLDGLLVLARTIDKWRAALPGGTSGEYPPGGLSGMFLSFFEISPQELLDVVAAAQTEDDVVRWFRERTSLTDELRAAWNEEAEGHVVTDANRAYVYKTYPVAARNPQMTNLLDVLEADDLECFPEMKIS